MTLELVPLEPGTKLCACADMLYLGSFPDYEMVELGKLHEFSKRGCADYMALMDDGFRGLAYVIHDDYLLFLLYLAVSPSSRDGGYGSKALDAIKGMCGNRRMFLNIEPVESDSENYEQRVRRLGFYRRNGMKEHGIVDTPDGQRYMMMCWNGDVSDDEVNDFYRRVTSDLFEN